MSAFNGSGTFVISGTGLPFTTNTTISSTVANQLNSDLATGLSTCLTKDGQTTPTANITLGGYKITNIAAATTTGDALSYGRAATVTTLATTGATTLGAALTYGGVTLSNAVTGTGNMVLSASPTLTGTLTAATISASGNVSSGGTLTVGNSHLYPGASATLSSGGTNYDIGSVASLSGYISIALWNSGLGYAIVFIDASGNLYLISSSNSAGGNSAFDTTNNFASNGGNGIAITANGGRVYAQTKSSYTGPTPFSLAQIG